MKNFLILLITILTISACEREATTVTSNHLSHGIVTQVQCYNGVKGFPNLIKSAPYEVVLIKDDGKITIEPITLDEYETIIVGDTIR